MMAGSRAGARPLRDIGPGDGHARRGSLLMWLLLLAYTFNFLDRQVLNILAEPIKLEMGLTDSQLGMLTGLSFAILYTVLGIPIGRMADRANRVGVIGVSMVCWTGFTIACGFAANLLQLAVFRIGVGVGEAGCTPAAHSLISDCLPEHRRARALAFYSLGVPIGSLLGLTLGGVLAHAIGWRMTMVAVGAPGLLIAVVIMIALKDPRHASRTETREEVPSLAEVLAELRRKPSFWWLAFGAAFTSFTAYGQAAFMASFYLRNHSAALPEFAHRVGNATGLDVGNTGVVGSVLGLTFGLTGILGTLAGGMLAERKGARFGRAYTSVPAAASVIAVPAYTASLLVSNFTVSLALLTVPLFLKAIWHGPVYASVQGLVRPQSRATAAALLLFIVNIIGLGMGPLCVGALSDLLSRRLDAGEGLRLSMIVCGSVGLLSAVCFQVAGRFLTSELEAGRRRTDADPDLQPAPGNRPAQLIGESE